MISSLKMRNSDNYDITLYYIIRFVIMFGFIPADKNIYNYSANKKNYVNKLLQNYAFSSQMILEQLFCSKNVNNTAATS